MSTETPFARASLALLAGVVPKILASAASSIYLFSGCSSNMARPPQTTTSYSAILERHTPGGREAGAPIQTLSDVSEQRGARDAAAAQLWGRQMPPEWAETGVVFEDQYVIVVRDAVRFANGSLGTYIRVLQKPLDRTGAVVVVEKDGRYLLVRHYRHATGRYHREFVRGWAKPDDVDGAATARREVREELGVAADDIAAVRVLGFGYPDSGLLATRVCFAVVTIAPHAKLTAEENEGIVGDGPDEPAVIALTRAEIRALVRDGLIDDNFTLSALQLLEASDEGRWGRFFVTVRVGVWAVARGGVDLLIRGLGFGRPR